MKILQTNYQPQYNTNFKAIFPVVHWVSEANGSYAPVAEKQVVELFQVKILEFLRKSIDKTLTEVKKLSIEKNKKNISDKDKRNIERKLKSLYEILDVPAQNLRAYLASCDVDYRLNPKARSYYNTILGSVDTFTPTSFFLTGPTVTDFENKFAKELGKQNGLRINRIKHGATPEEAETPEFKKAQRKYNYEGYNYVNSYQKRIKDNQGRTQTLHTKFQIERDSDGKFTGYKFIDARFLPEYGPESPFERLKSYLKSAK